MSFDPKIFGMGFHKFVSMEFEMFGSVLSPILHLATLVILFLVFRHGNKYRKLFTVYFLLNWVFLLVYWGVLASIYWAKIGAVYLLNFVAVPILLTFIVVNWIKEFINPKIDLDFSKVKKPRFIVLLILIWGFWYPTYIYSQGFVFKPLDLLYSYYGLMPCPTTMVVLSLLTLKYPKSNNSLYNLLTAYAIFIGIPTVATGWLPDIPLIILGLYAFSLVLFHKRCLKKQS